MAHLWKKYRNMSTMESTSPSNTDRDTNSALSSSDVVSRGTDTGPTSSSNPETSKGTNCASSDRESNSSGMSLSNQQQSQRASANNNPCPICGDEPTGYSYGAYVCNACKLFFCRTVRDRRYFDTCVLDCKFDKKSRFDCRYCRYQKCVAVGMKPESVGITRKTSKPEVQSASWSQERLEQIREPETRIELWNPVMKDIEMPVASESCQASEFELLKMVEWTKHVPYFDTLPLDDRVILLRAGLDDLLILGIAYRSMYMEGALKLANGLIVYRHSAEQLGLTDIFIVLSPFVTELEHMRMDSSEYTCLKSIILFNPGTPGLPNKSIQQVKYIRNILYEILESRTHTKHPAQPFRYSDLLLRLPDLRTASMTCREHLFLYRVVPGKRIEDYLKTALATAIATPKKNKKRQTIMFIDCPNVLDFNLTFK